MGQIIKIKLSVEEREELEALVGRPTEEAGLVRRARVILLSDRGVSGREIALRLDLTPEYVSKVRTWFRTGGVGGLRRPRSGRKDHAVPAVTRHPHGATARQGHGAGWKHEQPEALMPRVGPWRRGTGGARQGADVGGGAIRRCPAVVARPASGPEPQAEESRGRRWA
jgi:Winged helix-turn helix